MLLDRLRFSSDARGAAAIQADPELNRLMADAQAGGWASQARMRALSSAVKVQPRLLPELAASVRAVAEHAGVDESFECFVFAHDAINGMVMEATDRKVVMLSSAAVERLRGPELAFVIGHELGHAHFGHLGVPVGAILDQRAATPGQAMRLLAWQRKAEISADRAGLLACGSIDVAATALFKTLSGLDLPGLAVEPEQFAGQWDELASEVIREGQGNFWMASHPFPPLRMKALLHFWSSDCAATLIPGSPGGEAIAAVDEEVDALLATMDPLARNEGTGRDPLIEEFLLWGGMFIAAASGGVAESELQSIRSLTGADAFEKLVGVGTAASPEVYRDRFLAVRRERRKPLSALELHRIFSGLVAIARADGRVDAEEIGPLRTLAEACAVNPLFIERLIDQ